MWKESVVNYIIFAISLRIVTCDSGSDVIGSSVVTSVSVVLSNDQNLSPKQESLSDTLVNPNNEEIVSNFNTNPLLSATALLRKSGRKEGEGVQNVILALKNIVQEEQQKHGQALLNNAQQQATSTAKSSTITSNGQSTTNTNVVQSADESPPPAVTETKMVPGSSLSGEDDDEMESSGPTDTHSAPPNTGLSMVTDAIDDFAKHVVSIQPVEQDNENDTATSAEVNDAIHKISGAILSVDDEKTKKPIENIVTEVLTKINTARNSTQESPKPVPPTTAAPTKPGTTKKPFTTKKPPKTTLRTTVSPTTLRPKPPQTTTSSKPTKYSNQNKLKTELEPEMQMDVKEEKMSEKNNHKVTHPIQTPTHTAELPMIIMLNDDSKAPMKSQADEKPSKKHPMPAMEDKDKPEMMDKDSNMDTATDMMDKESDIGQPETYSETRLPGLPVDEQFAAELGGGWVVINTNNKDQQDISLEDDQDPNVHLDYTTLRPYVTPPTKGPTQYFQGKRPGNESTSSLRPNEFYDDEIFGYDPYQTFFHGVYVPVVEVGSLPETHGESEYSSEEEYVQTTAKPRRPNRPHAKHGKPTKTKKPVPTLPDYLHRPRPSHMQYQHVAVDKTDPMTGMPNPTYPEDELTPDKLSLNSRPALAQTVRKNFTDHHDHHILHQHGFGSGGHGHGGHDSSSHGSSHGDHSQSHDHAGHSDHGHDQGAEKRPNFSPAPSGNPGLEATLTSLDEEKRLFVDINNRLALRLMGALSNPVSKASSSYGNMVISPFTVTSSLGMMFLGARGQTAAQLDGLLQLDDMLTFNPHMMFHNVTESFLSQPNTAAAIIRLLVTDKEKGDVLEFYKTRVQHFYEARVEEVDYKFAGHLAQSIINQMIRAQIQRHSYEMLNYSLPLAGPMSLLTAAFFDGQFAATRDTTVDSMNFIHLAALGQSQSPTSRRLFQVPAVALKGNFRAAYDKDLDATAVEIPYSTRDLSLIAVMPGKPGEFAIGGVTSLKSRLSLDAWTKLMRGFYPRDNFKVVLPRFRHQTSVNLSNTLSRFGLTDMFEPTLAKFKGINGLADLHLDHNMMHFAEFGTWEKLSDTLNESNNRNLDLIRILRPHVREHYGNFGEPMSVNEWIFKSRNPDEKRSQPDNIPDDVSRLRMELERLRRGNGHHHSASESPAIFSSKSYSNSNSKSSGNGPSNSYSRVRTSIEFRPRRALKTRSRRSKVYYFRQESNSSPEEETVLRFERPFLYFLRHNPTGMLLMSGQYTEPVTEILE